jgi:hypothetical protein
MGDDCALHALFLTMSVYVADEHDFFWRERFAKLGGERVF